MREAGLLAPTRLGHAHGPAAHDGTIIPDRPDAMWGTDATAGLTGEGRATIFVAVDHFTAECVWFSDISAAPVHLHRGRARRAHSGGQPTSASRLSPGFPAHECEVGLERQELAAQ